jgi:putative cardiolipin synthase
MNSRFRHAQPRQGGENKKHFSYALLQTEQTFLGTLIKKDVEARSGQSGFFIFETGDESLNARIELIRSAEKTIDLQYYAISDDLTSNLLIEALIQAARRGIRIRLLIDDISIGPIHYNLSVFDHVKNIEIRVFNPITTRDQSVLVRIMAFIMNPHRATRRMHNKALIVDNQMAIIGGRNLGDEYFDAHSEFSFKDIDVLTAGPITQEISESFDEFWNGTYTFPLSSLYKPVIRPDFYRRLRKKLRRNWEAEFNVPKEEGESAPSFKEALSARIGKLVWAPSELIVDKAKKIEGNGSKPGEPINYMRLLVDDAESEFIIVTPYFVPLDSGVAWLGGLRKRGMSVRILTNSLASTDVVAVHSGYRRYRKSILQQNAELYELKPIAGKPKQRPLGRKTPSYASLHAKVYIVDKEHAIIGSFNFDPRSSRLNTEIGVVIHSPQISMQLYRMFEEAISPPSAYKVVLEDGMESLAWLTEEKGQSVRFEAEPRASLWRKIQTFFISLLPVEDQL